MNYFFDELWNYDTHVNDFELFGIIHISILLFVAAIILFIYLKRDKIKKLPLRSIEIILGLIMITPRVLLYFWYGTYESSLQEILPLYLCRITIMCTAFTLFTGKNNVRFVTYFWGMFGSILALIFVDTSGYGFPHIMFISFFVGHGLLAISVFYMIFIREYLPSYDDFKKAKLWTIIYILVACVVNRLVGGNYNYLERNPSVLNMPVEFVNSIFYKLMILGSFLLIQCILYLPVHLIRKREADSENNDICAL
ncbi:TIGR02206 family membrane protein [Clostridium sediminicola]|uniref:TMEM164-related integral membrane acyltransferase n=1 Tax=Clostridium sediminicola TaxID=3114879 RepID=UPI0031F27820